MYTIEVALIASACIQLCRVDRSEHAGTSNVGKDKSQSPKKGHCAIASVVLLHLRSAACTPYLVPRNEHFEDGELGHHAGRSCTTPIRTNYPRGIAPRRVRIRGAHLRS